MSLKKLRKIFKNNKKSYEKFIEMKKCINIKKLWFCQKWDKYDVSEQLSIINIFF